MIRLLTVGLLFAGFHVAADVTLPNHLQENSVASAADVMDNFNALAGEMNSQDARITIVEKSVGGGTIARTFAFSGWVAGLSAFADCSGSDAEFALSCLGVKGSNDKCRIAYGVKYVAANLDVLAAALKYGASVSFPTEECGVIISNYTDPQKTWYTPLMKTSGSLIDPDNETALTSYCGASPSSYTLLCGYWD